MCKVKNAGEWVWLPGGFQVPQEISTDALLSKQLVPRGQNWDLVAFHDILLHSGVCLPAWETALVPQLGPSMSVSCCIPRPGQAWRWSPSGVLVPNWSARWVFLNGCCCFSWPSAESWPRSRPCFSLLTSLKTQILTLEAHAGPGSYSRRWESCKLLLRTVFGPIKTQAHPKAPYTEICS